MVGISSTSTDATSVASLDDASTDSTLAASVYSVEGHGSVSLVSFGIELLIVSSNSVGLMLLKFCAISSKTWGFYCLSSPVSLDFLTKLIYIFWSFASFCRYLQHPLWGYPNKIHPLERLWQLMPRCLIRVIPYLQIPFLYLSLLLKSNKKNCGLKILSYGIFITCFKPISCFHFVYFRLISRCRFRIEIFSTLLY